MLVVPPEVGPERPPRRFGRHPQLPPLKRVVVPPVLEVGAYPPTDLELQLRGHRHVSAIEQRVQVAPQEESVVDPMLAALAVGLDVCSLQGRERALAGPAFVTGWEV